MVHCLTPRPIHSPIKKAHVELCWGVHVLNSLGISENYPSNQRARIVYKWLKIWLLKLNSQDAFLDLGPPVPFGRELLTVLVKDVLEFRVRGWWAWAWREPPREERSVAGWPPEGTQWTPVQHLKYIISCVTIEIHVYMYSFKIPRSSLRQRGERVLTVADPGLCGGYQPYIWLFSKKKSD